MKKAVWSSCVLMAFCGGALAQLDKNNLGPKVQITPYASVDAVAPGASFDFALAIEIQDKWHMYWKNQGDSGMPPKIVWSNPDGFSSSEWRFPVPHRKTDSIGMTTNVLDGTPILTTTLTAPSQLKIGTDVTLRAQVELLVCKEACVMVKRDVELRLPVRATAERANLELFDDAAHFQPVAAKNAKHAQVSAVASVDRIRPGDSAELAIILDLKEGLHVQSNTPLAENFIATELFYELANGIELGPIKYPEHHVVERSGIKMAEYSGDVVIKIPIKADQALEEALNFSGIARYQACNEAGTCFPPENVEWSVIVPSAPLGAAVMQSKHEAFSVAARPPTPPTSWMQVIFYCAFAALGGLILNIMPCVLPVIAIKILSFVQQAGEEPRRVFMLGLSFSAGIVVSFLALGIAIVQLQTFGQSVGWGFQLSNPMVVVAISGIIFLFALSLLGVFEFNLPGRLTNQLGHAEQKEGMTGSFLKGVLATILATPCTAPFLGTAMVWALQKDTSIVLLAMFSVGLGMAFPYILLTANPAWMKFLPKPGTWMEQFKQIMGFVLLATVVWLFETVQALVDEPQLRWVLAFFALLGFAGWIIGQIKFTMPTWRQYTHWVAASLVCAIGWWLVFGISHVSLIAWRTWSPNIGPQLAGEGCTVFIDYTATWCATCKTNKISSLERNEVAQKMEELGVIAVKADYSSYGPDEMTSEIRNHGQPSVPVNVIHPAGKPNDEDKILLPQVLIPSIVLDALDRAGPSQDCKVDSSAGKLAQNSI